MRYVIVKGNKKLGAFFRFEVPVVRRKITKITDYGVKSTTFKDAHTSSKNFMYYKDSYWTFDSYKEAEDFLNESIISCIKENANYYESFLSGSTQKLLNYANKLKIIPDDEIFNK